MSLNVGNAEWAPSLVTAQKGQYPGLSAIDTMFVPPPPQVLNLNPPGAPGWLGQLSIQTLDFSLGHDLTVRELEPHIGLCTDSVEPAWDSLSPSLSTSPL